MSEQGAVSEWAMHVQARNGERMALPAGVAFAPQSWSAEASGGPAAAEVVATGPLERLVEMAHWLGCRVWISNPSNEYVWWGWIEEIALSAGGMTVGSTLAGTANRIKVLYTLDAPGGETEAAETGWVEDAQSIARYGKRERQHTARSPMSAAQALQLRDTLLARVSRPAPVIGEVGGGGETQVRLSCVGFWGELAQIYYGNANGTTEYLAGDEWWPLGLGFVSTLVAAAQTDGKSSLAEMEGRFQHFDVEGMRVTVSGTTWNNGMHTVKSADAKEPIAYETESLEFEPGDDVYDGALGLGDIETGDLIQIVGTGQDGTNLVKTPGRGRIEVSPGYRGALVHSEGPTEATILRGNKIMVEGPVVNEQCGDTVTVTAHGKRIAQAFWTETPAAWVLHSIEIKLRKIGAPVDNVQVRLYSHGAGVPGTWLATGTVAGSAVVGGEDGRWVAFVMDNAIALANSAPYWMVVQRSGADDWDDLYEVQVDGEGGYGLGGLLLDPGDGSWVSPLNALSLTWRLRGAVDTAVQVGEICAAAGTFAGVLVADESGLKTNQTRDGSLFAADEAQELLDTGDGTATRLIASVNHQRYALIRKAPAQASAQYVWRDGSLFTLQGTPAPAGVLPVGEWCHIDNPLLRQGALAEAATFFVEGARYAPGNGWTLRAAGEPDPWRIGEMRDG